MIARHPSGKHIRVWLVVLTLAVVAQVGPTLGEGGKPAPIDRSGVLILVRTTLLAVDAANKTGNYTVLRDLAAPGFASANTAARLGDVFAGNRRDGLDLSGIAVLDPQLTVLPEIEQNGMMRMAGFFPSVPKQVNFDLLYQPVAGQWRLFGINLNVGPSGPVAPMPDPPPPDAPPAKTVARTPPRAELHKTAHVKKSETGQADPEPASSAQQH